MPDTSALDSLPIGLFTALVLVAILVAIELGYRFGRTRRSRSESERGEVVGAMVGSALGLVALMIAFVFGIAANRFEAKRQAMFDEVNAIGTAYLRADFLPEPQRSEVKALLRDYTDVRILAASPGQLQAGVQKTNEIHNKLWNATLTATAGKPSNHYTGLFIATLNEVIDLHGKRVAASFHSRIPDFLWVVLMGVTLLSLASSGYFSGITGASRSPLFVVVAVMFAVIIGLILDLERPLQGHLRIGVQSIVELRESLK